MAFFKHDPHPWREVRGKLGPPRVADAKNIGNIATRFNTRAALLVTKVVGSMWCAYAFALFDLISLPAAIRGGSATVVSWVAQTFLQLVLLSVIMVGQGVQADAADKRSEQTYMDAEAILHEALQLQAHLQAQDERIEQIITHLQALPPPAPQRADSSPIP